jgi:hypothetical protein
MPLRRGGLRLMGVKRSGHGTWRSGGTYGNSASALAEDPVHDQELLQAIRKELRRLGIELSSVTNLVVIADCKGLKRLRAWVAVRRVLTASSVKLDPFAMSPRL